jgi:hypothetical protein
MSYLADVKRDANRLISALKDEIEKCRTPEERDAVFRDWSREHWSFLQEELKRSYQNGVKSVTEDPGSTGQTRRFAGWRNRKAGKTPEVPPREEG